MTIHSRVELILKVDVTHIHFILFYFDCEYYLPTSLIKTIDEFYIGRYLTTVYACVTSVIQSRKLYVVKNKLF